MEETSDFKSKSNENFSVKETEILKRCKRFFSTDQKYINKMLEIINGDSNISIRVLDWFVANYSKKNDTTYKIKINGICQQFNVNLEYKNQLTCCSKRHFDPFCRKKKITYKYESLDKNKVVKFESSIGQLNFFHWAIRNKVIEYLSRHLLEIETDMKKVAKETKERKLVIAREAKIISDSRMISDDTSFAQDPDPEICSSDNIKSIFISPSKKSDEKATKRLPKRQQLSKSIYDFGIKKTNNRVVLDFN